MLSAGTGAFEFAPAASNYVGNYPPGLVGPAGPQLIAAFANASAAATAASGVVILRDMGKTIFAPIATSYANLVAGTAGSNYGYFRQVQLLIPGAISSTQGFIGGTSGSNFGVQGAANVPDAYTDYFTFYVPVTIGGILGTGSTVLTPIAGGQM